MIYSFSPFGYDGSLINVEVDLRRGIPATDIVGLADNCVKEARERVRCAIKNGGFEYPSERVLISLSPADLKKEGTGFDLAVALAILYAKKDAEGEITHAQNENVMVLGELDLNGNIRPVKGVSAALQLAVESGIKYAIIPKEVEKEPDGILCYRASNLEEAFYALKKVDDEDTYETFCDLIEMQKSNEEPVKVEFENVGKKEIAEFDGMTSHNGLKFAMAVAIAGRHNMLVYGRPGCGKTMMLQKMPLLMPKLLPDERKSTTRIWSLAGLLRPDKDVVRTRPFRMPHQTASIEGICGGGVNCHPGEISLAHNGVLFLDEAAEFRSSVLQMLRVPIENGNISLSRAGRSTCFPAKFQLVMATEPCPCGNLGSKEKVCLCNLRDVDNYWKKFSAPLLDRVAIRFDDNNSNEDKQNYAFEEYREMIKNAWQVQLKRQGKLNQDLAPQEMEQIIKLSNGAKETLDKNIQKYGYSPREVSNILKLARTVCDVWSYEEGPYEEITELGINEAIELHGKMPY